MNAIEKALPQARIIDDIFAFSVTNVGLTEDERLGRFWRWMTQVKSGPGKGAALGKIAIQGRNMLQVVRSADMAPGGEALLIYKTAVPLGQSALAIFLILTGLLLVVFVEPPTAWRAGADELGGGWRPTLVALGSLLLFGVILFVPPLRDLATLQLPSLPSFGLIAVATLIWMFLLRWIWRANALERFLDVDFGVGRPARAPEGGRYARPACAAGPAGDERGA